MAKLKGPLFSLGASQQLGKTLVYFNWKGLDVVREYVVPSNPKTAGQTTQRGYLTAAVAKIHAAQALAANALDAADISAYALLASVVKAATTWFNQAVKEWVDCKVAGNDPLIYSNFTVSDATVGAFDCIVYLNEETGSQLANGKFYFGTSKTALIHSFAGVVNPGVDVDIVAGDLSAFLTAGVKYFVQFRPDAADPSEGCNSGIYYFTAI